jgi:hypothetical protein
MLLEFQEKFTGARLTRPVANLSFFRAKAGKITTFDIWADFPASLGDVVFNMRINGVAVWTGTDRPKLLATESHVAKTGLSITVAKGDIVSIDAEIVGVDGLSTPITFQTTIDDEIPNGTTEQIQDMIAGFIVAGSNVTVTYNDVANTLTIAATGGGGGGSGVVETIVAGTGINVDSTDPANPIVSATGGGAALGLFSPDLSYSAPSTEDDEFLTGPLDAKWTELFLDTGSVSFTQFVVPNHISLPGNGNATYFNKITQPAPSGVNSEWAMKIVCEHNSSDFVKIGLIMETPDRGGYKSHNLIYLDNVNQRVRHAITYDDSEYTFQQDLTIPSIQGQSRPIWLRGKYTHSTKKIDFAWSVDGIGWQWFTQADLGGYALTKVGIVYWAGASNKSIYYFVDWFRKWQGAYIGGTY